MPDKKKLDEVEEKTRGLEKISEIFKEIFQAGGNLWIAYDFISTVWGGSEPSEKSSRAAKLAHGGLFSFKDEIAMDGIEAKLDEHERTTLRKFREWIVTGYGNGFLGYFASKFYLNQFRALVVRMRTPEKVTKLVSTTDKKGGKKTEEIKNPPDDSHSVDFLKRFAAVIQENSNDRSGDRTGFAAGISWLRQKSMPTPSFVEKIREADGRLKRVPANFGENNGSWSRSMHESVQQLKQRRAAQPWWYRWLSW